MEPLSNSTPCSQKPKANISRRRNKQLPPGAGAVGNINDVNARKAIDTHAVKQAATKSSQVWILLWQNGVITTLYLLYPVIAKTGEISINRRQNSMYLFLKIFYSHVISNIFQQYFFTVTSSKRKIDKLIMSIPIFLM